MNRRSFMQTLSLVGAAPGLPLYTRVRAADNPPKPLKVIVVGAGLAGLTAGYELEQKGHTVTLLEADPKHLGGRVRTQRFANGRYGELGAMRIPKQHDLTRKYVTAFGLKLRPFVNSNPEAYTVARGKKVRQKDAAQLAAAYKLDLWERGKSSDALWERAVTEPLKKLTDAERKDLFAVTPKTPAVRNLDRLSLRQLFQNAGLSDEAIEYLAVTQSEETLFHTAATEVLRDEVLEVYSQDLDEIVGGLDELPKAFAAKLRTKPRTGCEVTEIVQNPDRGTVTARYTEGGQEKEVAADYLVCAVPLSVLGRVKLAPAFSPAKQRAIRQLHYESATKVLLDCATRCWEKDDGIFGGGTITDLPTGMTYYPSDNPTRDAKVSAGPGVLLASYSWGMASRRLAVGSPEEVVKRTVKHLSAVHPGLAEKGAVLDSAVWNWDTHRWTAGGFAWFLPGQHTEFHRHLLEPEGRIVLAGEHASLAHSWMQGAIESGLHAVQSILELSKKPAGR